MADGVLRVQLDEVARACSFFDAAGTSVEATDGVPFGEDHSSWFDDGYTNVRPLNIRE